MTSSAGLESKLALVTGAGGGIGRAVSRALGQEGAALVLSGRTEARLYETAEAISGAAEVHVVPADLGVDRDVTALAAAAAGFGGPDILVHCAGVIQLGPLETMSPEDLDRQYAINLRAPVLLTKACLPELRARRGFVVFLNSTVGLTSRAEIGAYAASKHGLRAIADTLRDEVNADGIRVLSVYLGRTATPMQETVFAAEGNPYSAEGMIQPADVAAMIVAAIRLPDTAEVTEIRVRPARKSNNAG